jgi:starch synthase
MPSRYEPCGLNQMYSLKYGTVPIVRATGGLLDTVQPWDPKTWQGNGFHLSDDAPESLVEAVKDALAVYKNRDAWSVIMRNGMMQDYSWARSAGKYVQVYRELASSGS